MQDLKKVNFKKEVDLSLIKVKKKYKKFLRIYYFLNILILFATFTTSLISILVVSKIWIFNTEIPWWFPIFTAGLGAFSSLISSLFNFFLVRNKIQKFFEIKIRIQNELNKYNTEIEDKYSKKEVDRDLNLFLTTKKIMGHYAAKRMV